MVKKIHVNGIENFPKSGPVLMAGTHPNSFLDASLMHLIQPRPVWSLARGDAFKGGFVSWFLEVVKIIPIYRISEGKENLAKNDATFEKCQELFSKNEVVLIFSEGLCTNQRELLPLKKGTGRLAFESWNKSYAMPILPMGITYNAFQTWGKIVNVRFGKTFGKADFDLNENPAKLLKEFNAKLEPAMKACINQEFPAFHWYQNPIYYIGWLLNFPLYLLIQKLVNKKFKRTVFVDSIYFFALFLSLPIYWLILGLILYFSLCLF